jgi:hypothetical protein
MRLQVSVAGGNAKTDHTPALVRLVASVLRNVVIAAGILTYQ